MPGMDGTGPLGMGPMTGGGRGWCNPYFAGWRAPMMGYSYFPSQYGWGGQPPFWAYGEYWPGAGYMPTWAPYPPAPWAFGRWGPYGGPYYSPREKTQFLKDEAEMMRKELKEIEARIQQLEKN